MFRMTQSPKFWATVRSEVQAENGNRQTVMFDMEFKRLSQSELRSFADRTAAGVIASTDVVETAVERIMEVATNWRNVTDAEGGEVTFSREAVHQAVNEFGLGPAILAAFYESMPKAKAKN